MAHTVGWTGDGADDLDDVARFIARDSPAYAQDLVHEALAAARSLRQFPERGRVIPEGADPAYRELFIRKSYGLLDRIDENRVFVVGFVHAARDLAALWERYEKPDPTS
ncbi:MAG: type II toxin-antitoxin system RelE/ParE family toxin [Thermoanaerobaculia bacterium]